TGKQVTESITLTPLSSSPPDGGDDAHDGGADAGDAVDADEPDADGADAPATDGPRDAPIENPNGAADGTPCTTGSQCRNGKCVDSVCCNSDCSGKCFSCAPSGVCTAIPAGADPDNECEDK